MLFCCLWHNVETSCYKHFVVISRHQQTLPLTTSNKCHNLPRSGGAVLIAPGSRSIYSTLQILAGNRNFCLPHLHSTPPLGGFLSEYRHDVWYGKTRMVWLPDGEQILKICLFILTEFTNVMDRRTNGWTPHDGMGRTCIASHGKNDDCVNRNRHLLRNNTTR